MVELIVLRSSVIFLFSHHLSKFFTTPLSCSLDVFRLSFLLNFIQLLVVKVRILTSKKAEELRLGEVSKRHPLCVCPPIDDKLRHNIVEVAAEPRAAGKRLRSELVVNRKLAVNLPYTNISGFYSK